MRRISFFSGGIVSFFATVRDVERRGLDGLTMLFTDTLIEDADLYRFLIEGASHVVGRTLAWPVPRAEEFPETYLPLVAGERPKINPAWLAFLSDLRDRCARDLPELVWIAEGRTPWDVFNDVKIIGSPRKDPCSKFLKREIGLKWLVENCDPDDTTLIFGIHWEEAHRLEGEVWDAKLKAKVIRGVRPRYRSLGWPTVEAPMCDTPLVTPTELNWRLRAIGIVKPRLYGYGFTHNNCGGFCVKAGAGHFANLLRTMPERYAAHEAEEEAFNSARPGKARQTVLAPEQEVGGKRKRVLMSMAELRAKIDAGGQIDLFDTGGCGCFLDDPAEAA